jgi:uncharacterized protein YfaS (alpha-2-macroglobulin family)
MKAAKLILLFSVLFLSSCGLNEKKQKEKTSSDIDQVFLPIDKGYDEYISSYTSGIVPVNGTVEIRFTPGFAAIADKEKLSGLFDFEPSIKGKAEWVDDYTLVFTPSKLLDPATVYTGSLYLSRIGKVNDRLRIFPINIETVKKDFTIQVNNLEYTKDGESYNLGGELIASDFIDPGEVESYVTAKLNKKILPITWDHTSTGNIHKFVVEKVMQTDEKQELVLSWDGNDYGVKLKASTIVVIPRKNDFSIQNINVVTGENQRIDIVLSEPVDPEQELDGLIWFSPQTGMTLQVNSNIISVFPEVNLQGTVNLNIEPSLRSAKGISLSSARKETLEFTTIKPGIKPVGKGIIIPASGNLVFPFMAANLRAVDLTIVKIFENNLPYYLQNNDLDEEGNVKRFGRPVYSGRIDLVNSTSTNNGRWNMHTIDLSDYINVEAGVLYKIQLRMRKSYSLYSCQDNSGPGKYEEMLMQSEDRIKEFWEDADSYYEDYESSLFYRYAYDWRERDDPCNEAYFSPDRNLSRNFLASNLGLMAKMDENNKMIVFVNDLRTTEPVSDASVDIYDLQMQLINSVTTSHDGTASVSCSTKPFLVIVNKGGDRNYLKTNDGSSLSLSSFDISGVKPEKGIKTFIYGERDVWRPGDSIYISVLIRDMKKDLPPGHPVQFELVNPLEQRVDNQVHNLPASGLLVFRTMTPDNAVTGNYTATIKVGGASFNKRVRIETIKPNRLKIDLNFQGDLLGGTGAKETGHMKVKWLNGAVARNLKASVELLFRSVKTSFPGYPQYLFDDPASRFDSQTITIFDGSVDDKGDATIEFEPAKELNAPGMLNAVFTARVFEKGGDASIIQKSYRFAPYKSFVGISFPELTGKSRMLYTDADNVIKIATVDKMGKPVNSDVEINIYKISYRWWWEANDENLGNYISGRNYKPIITKKITTKEGGSSFTFKINKDDWGRYLVRATSSSGHSSGRIILVDWPWDYGSKGSSEGATILTVNTDKEKYSVGENIQLSFPSPPGSRAIISLENATGILDELYINTSDINSVVNIKATPEMAPNVYAYITLIQPHGQTVNDMPVRLYGIVPVLVEDPSTRLKPQIIMSDEVRSQQTFEIKVSEANSKPMSYTLAVVDEGLLDITGFHTPDPWDYFYAREALGVKTWDIYDYVLGALGGTLDRALAIGGDEALKDKSAARVRRFVPVVKFSGPYELGKGKTNIHKITLPLYTGSVKTMVIAGNDNAFGITDKQVLVRDPLMILATAPRVLSPGEKVSLPVTIFIQQDNITKVTVEASGNDLISFTRLRQDIPIEDMGEKDINFEFTTADRTGKAEISITASGGGESAKYKMEIDIRSPNPPETRSELRILKPGEKYEKSFTPFGIQGTETASLEVSSLPSVNLGERLDYLIEYPHGCSEQIVSAVFPQLWLKAVVGNGVDITNKSSANIMEGIRMLMTRQMPGGGIALWPGSYQPDNWVTSYAGHFILEAEKLGYNIPSGFKQKLLSYQRKSAQSWRYETNFRYSANDQAYRLFTLALAGQPEKGAMNRLRESQNIPLLSKWLLAASFAITGRPEIAEELIDVRSTDTEPDFYNYYYGSYLRDKAIILYTLTILNRTEQALLLLKTISDNLNKNTWYSTQTIAWGLSAYMKFAETMPADESHSGKVSTVFNRQNKEMSFSSRQSGSETLDIKEGENNLRVENTSGSTVYVNLIRRGIPLKTDILKENKGLIMDVQYLSMDLMPINEKMLEQGTDFAMVVKVTNSTFSRVDNIALTQMVPAGWEIQNTRLFETVMSIKESSFDYRDFRDDRIYTYFSLDRGETKTFIVILNASYKGYFFQPALWCEAMYDGNCYSRIPGKEVVVTGQNIE